MSPGHVIELVLLAAIWGASFLFQRVAAPEFGPAPLVAARVGIAALILTAVLAMRGGLHHLKAHWRILLLLGALNTAIPFTLFAFATLHVTAGVASVLNGTVPLFAAAIGLVWLGERPDRHRLFGLLLGFVGVLLLVWKDGGRAGAPGVLAGLGASVLYAFSAHLTRRRLAGVDPLAVAAGSQLGATALIIVPALWWLPSAVPSARAGVSALLLGVFCTGLAYVLYFRLVANVGAVRAMAVTYLIPVFGMLWGWWFLAEGATVRMALGAILVLVGVAFATGMWRPVPSSAPKVAARSSLPE